MTLVLDQIGLKTPKPDKLRAFDPIPTNFKDNTVFHTLEKNISELPYEPSYDLLKEASEDYLRKINTPISQINEPTREIPSFMNHDAKGQNIFVVFEEKYLKEYGKKAAFFVGVLVVSLMVDVLIGALIISWKLNLPEYCFRK